MAADPPPQAARGSLFRQFPLPKEPEEELSGLRDGMNFGLFTKTATSPGQVTDMAIGPGEVLWIMVGGRVYYWKDDAFRQPEGDRLFAGLDVTRFFGGGDRGLYLTQPDERKSRGKLYRLADGRAELVTDFHYESTHGCPGLYVSKAGLLINWVSSFLSVYRHGKWTRHDAILSASGLSGFALVETGGKVYLLDGNVSYCVTADGHVEERRLEINIPQRDWMAPAVVPWGEDRVLVADSGQVLHACDLRTGRAVAVASLAEKWKHDIWQFRGSDCRQRPWACQWTYDGSAQTVYRITPAGELDRVGDCTGLYCNCWRPGPPNTVLTADGSYWLIANGRTLARCHGDRADVFGPAEGVPPGSLWFLIEGRGGKSYTSSDRAILMFDPAQPAFRLPEKSGHWESYQIVSCPPVRDSAGNIWAMLRDRPGRISRWDGQTWHDQKVPFPLSPVG
jgi:hypothetical protein